MDWILNILILLIAVLHLFFLLLEMWFWTRPLGRKIFRLSEEQARSTRKLAANQGLYNGFLAAGLLWGLMTAKSDVQLFFLCCVFIAGVFGALTVSKNIFWVQAMPAMLALILLLQLI